MFLFSFEEYKKETYPVVCDVVYCFVVLFKNNCVYPNPAKLSQFKGTES